MFKINMTDSASNIFYLIFQYIMYKVLGFL